MTAASVGSAHAIAYLRVLSADGDMERSKGNVYCPRQDGSVPLERCARCPRFVKVDPGLEAGQEAVVCHADAPAVDTSAGTLALNRLSVSALMTRNVVCVRPDLTLDALSTLFLETDLPAVPVVDDAGHLLGFVSQADMMLAVQVGARGPEGPLLVSDVVLPFAIAVPESTSVTQAAGVMAFEGQQRVAVTAPDGSVVGILAASDVLYWLARSDGHLMPARRPSWRP